MVDENKLSKNESNKNQLGEKEFDTDKYNKLIADRQFRKALSYLVELPTAARLELLWGWLIFMRLVARE